MKFFCAILAAGMMTGPQLKAEPQLDNAIDAIVNVAIVTRYQVFTGVQLVAGRLAEQYRNQPENLRKKIAELETDVRTRLVEDQLILHEFNTAGYTLPESIIDNQVQQEIHNNYTDRATLTKSLQAEGITYERYRKQIRDRIIVRAMRFSRVSDAIIISPHKIESYYVTHTNDFGLDERVKLRMIVLTNAPDDATHAHKLAEEIVSKLNEGAAFAEMARLFSQGAHSSEGGAWNWVDRGMLRKELDDVVFTLNPGQRSGIIDTPEACYIVLVEDKSPGHIKPLSEVRGEIESKLLAQEQDRLQKQWIDRLKKKTFVRYFLNQPGATAQ